MFGSHWYIYRFLIVSFSLSLTCNVQSNYKLCSFYQHHTAQIPPIIPCTHLLPRWAKQLVSLDRTARTTSSVASVASVLPGIILLKHRWEMSPHCVLPCPGSLCSDVQYKCISQAWNALHQGLSNTPIQMCTLDDATKHPTVHRTPSPTSSHTLSPNVSGADSDKSCSTSLEFIHHGSHFPQFSHL